MSPPLGEAPVQERGGQLHIAPSKIYRGIGLLMLVLGVGAQVVVIAVATAAEVTDKTRGILMTVSAILIIVGAVATMQGRSLRYLEDVMAQAEIARGERANESHNRAAQLESVVSQVKELADSVWRVRDDLSRLVGKGTKRAVVSGVAEGQPTLDEVVARLQKLETSTAAAYLSGHTDGFNDAKGTRPSD